VFIGGGVRGGGRPNGFGGGGIEDDVDTIRMGRFGCDLVPFSIFAEGVGGLEDSFMTGVCCSCESLKGDEGSEGW